MMPFKNGKRLRLRSNVSPIKSTGSYIEYFDVPKDVQAKISEILRERRKTWLQKILDFFF